MGKDLGTDLVAPAQDARVYCGVQSDTRCSEIGYTGYAVLDTRTNHLIEACGDAWRRLVWVRPGDPDTGGWFVRLPLETFGPMHKPQRLQSPPSPVAADCASQLGGLTSPPSGGPRDRLHPVGHGA